MADELQQLLDRIQSDGVDKAKAEGNALVEKARAEAAEVVENAKAKAAEILVEAEKDSKSFAVRAEQSLKQAARDTILSVQSAVEHALNALLSAEVEKTLEDDLVKSLIEQAVDTYIKAGESLEVTVPEARQAALAEWAKGAFQAEAGQGIDIRGDRSLAQGFRVSLSDGRIQHDFSAEAIGAALGELLRPQLAKLLKDAQASD